MKLKLTYFLLLGLLLLNGYKSVIALLQPVQPAKQERRPLENRNGIAFFISTGEVQPLPVNLFSDDNDDNDDDESRSVKKKSSPSGNFTALIDTLFQLCDQHFIKSASPFQRSVCYFSSDRYIFHCALKI